MLAPDGGGGTTGGAGGDFAASPTALREASKGLVAAMAELKAVSGAVQGDLGEGFQDIALTGMQVGDETLCSAFAEFADRWSWGVRVLFDEGTAFADDLNLAAGMFYDNDQYVKGTAKDLLVAGAGDPNESDQDVESHSLSWSAHQATAPDATTAQAGKHIEKTALSATSDEVHHSTTGYVLDRLTGGDLSKATSTAKIVPTDPDGGR
jgi:hypothetical protein